MTFPIRIKTILGENRVYTLFHGGEYITLIRIDGQTSSISSPNLLEAGKIHLTSSLKMRENINSGKN